MTVKEMREKRNKLVTDARAIYDAASEGMTEEQTRSFDAMMDDAEKLEQDIARAEKLETAERSLSESRGRMTRDEVRTPNAASDALRGFLLTGSTAQPTSAQLLAMQTAGLTGNAFELRLNPRALGGFEDADEWAQRALSTTSGAAGGYTVPNETMRAIEVALRDFSGMRQVASIVRTTNGADLPWPTNDDDNVGQQVDENTQVSEQDTTFGQRVLGSFKYSSKIIRVPLELVQDSAIDLASYIGARLGERIAKITNTKFTVGVGGGTEPEGVLTAAQLGVTAASATAITYDELVDLEHSVNAVYRQNATWMFNDSTLRALKKLKDANGVPLWMPSVAGSNPATILGHPYAINNDIPTIAASAKTIVFGDMSRYKIRDVMDVQVLRLNERYAEFGQIAFVAFSRHDGLLLDAGTHPVAYLQQSA